MASKTYTKNLIVPIVNASVSDQWETAVFEWDIVDCEEDETAETSCMCGHEGIRYCFQIRNRLNGNTFFPIGSECIKKFHNKDLSSDVDVYEKLFKLYEAIRKREFIEIGSKYFSRKLLLYFLEQNVIDESGYDFLLKMFNKRDKDCISSRQQSYINRLIGFEIKPHLMSKLTSKIHRRA